MRRALAAILLMSTACSTPRATRAPVAVSPAPYAPPAATTNSDAPPASRVARNAQYPFEVLDVSVAEAAEFFSEETGRSMVVDAGAQALARCVRISVEVPAGWRVEQVIDAIELAMVPSGLEVARRDDVYLIVVGPKVSESVRRRCAVEPVER